ncbi:hypothetical protein ACFPER_18265 [Agromyces aurantiacus]|uniref:DUF4287 domain-containing protein n=1 Tax=Agromyces aurantiacus TaxID=165814 RepID=A0ABV9RB17_9MICO|nr:hypothetical protein [Agromyces aurantiacus]MBM7505435.1 hypothetical protein [Agromyces aurantiacus]
MTDGSIGSSSDAAGDRSVREATGRSREDWFATLDDVGAAEWRHAEIAAWLAGDQGVDPWWSQHVTVAYEQARGIRDPGQRQDGSFEASVSRTVPLEPVAALDALADVVTAETGVEPLARNTGARHPTARFHLDGGEFVLAGSSPRDGGRSSISLTWGRMPDGSRIADVKAAMREWLARVG